MTLDNKVAKFRQQRRRLATDLNLGNLDERPKSKDELREMLATAMRNTAQLPTKGKKS